MTSAPEPDPERLYSLFLTLARIDSVSKREARTARFVRDFFECHGLECLEDGAGAATGGESGNLFVKVRGRGRVPGGPLVFNAHLDTVEPGAGVEPVEEKGRFSSGGDTVLGADDKAGVAAILCAVETVMNSPAGHRALEIVLTVQEELGLAGARNLDISMIDGRCGVVLDGSGKIGGIVIEAPSHLNMEFVVTGRSAHAGIEPEKGVNAIACASRAIASLELGRLDGGTTTNIGVIEGGRAFNVVPDRALVGGEIRSLSERRLDEERRRMVEAFNGAAAECGCSVEAKAEQSFKHYRLDEGSEHLKMIAGAMAGCGIEPFLITSGGGSDANIFNDAGLCMVNINAGFENAHSQREYIEKSDLLDMTRLLVVLATNGASDGGARILEAGGR
jgi:tripeptide aminopeptidase